MRPATVRIGFLLALALAALVSERSPALAQDGSNLGSDGLGVSRATWEETHGRGEPVDTSFSPVWGEIFTYGFDGGTYYAAFAGSKADDESVLVYLEIAFDGMVSFEDARSAVQPLLPSDATVVEPFFLPPTPGAPSALDALRYESPALATVPYGTGSLGAAFLVVYVEQIEATRIASEVDASINVETTVSRVSITVAIPEG